MKKILLITFLVLIAFSCPDQVAATTHPSLVVGSGDISTIRSRISSKAAVSDAYQRMKSQAWYAGAPSDVKAEGWSRQLVELSFTGYLDNDQNATSRAKTILLERSQGDLRYNFAIFNEDVRKYRYGQPCTALVLGYDFLYPSLNSSERETVRNLLTEWGSGLYSHYSGQAGAVSHNFHTSSVACLGLIGLALDGEVDAAPQWKNMAKGAFRDYFVNKAYNPGGDYTEGFRYQQYGLAPAVLFLDAVERNESTNLLQNSNLSRLWNFYLLAYGSNGSFPRYGDNSKNPFIAGTDLYLLRNADQANLRPEYMWLWYRLRGSLAAQPTDTYVFKDFDHLGMVLYFPDEESRVPTSSAVYPSQVLTSVTSGTTQGSTANPGGITVLRSDWNSSAFSTSLWLNNRWRWQNHQHYDPNAFTLEGYGQTLISNLNNRSYEDPLLGKWSQQNTVRIDPGNWDSDAPISAFTIGSAASLGTFPRFFQSEFADVVMSDSRYAHANFHRQGLPNGNFSAATTSNVTPIERAMRTVILIRQLLPMPFYLMYDDFKKSGSSEYWWQVYTPNSAGQISGNGKIDQPYSYVVGEAVMRMSFLNVDQPILTRGAVESGREDRPLRLAVQQPELKLLTLMYPSRASDPAPQIRKIQANPDVYEVSLEGQSAQIVFNPNRQVVVYQDIETDAQIAVGKNWSTQDRQLLFQEATFARIGGVDLFRTTQPSTQTVVSGSGGCVSASADLNGDGLVNLIDFSIFVGQLLQTGTNRADLNCDGVVDLRDFSLFTQQLRI